MVRPVKWLQNERQIEFRIAPCNPEGLIEPDEIVRAIGGNTRMVVISQASNVYGTIQPIAEIAALCRARGILLLVDAAQSAGVLPIDVEGVGIDLLAFTGHKALFGPQGTGGLYVRPGLCLKSLIEGGTGSISESMEQPDFMPDMLESGTPNTPGIAGLRAGVEFIESTGMHAVRQHEMDLCSRLLDGLREISGVKIYGPQDARRQTAVVSFNLDSMDCGQVAFRLEHEYGIISRSGLHCAPLAHASLGILQQGSCRLSMGYFNQIRDIESVIAAIYHISKN